MADPRDAPHAVRLADHFIGQLGSRRAIAPFETILLAVAAVLLILGGGDFVHYLPVFLLPIATALALHVARRRVVSAATRAASRNRELAALYALDVPTPPVTPAPRPPAVRPIFVIALALALGAVVVADRGREQSSTRWAGEANAYCAEGRRALEKLGPQPALLTLVWLDVRRVTHIGVTNGIQATAPPPTGAATIARALERLHRANWDEGRALVLVRTGRPRDAAPVLAQATAAGRDAERLLAVAGAVECGNGLF